MKSKLLKAILFSAVVTLFSGCSKPEKGDTGPQGPAGPQGNANVKSYTNTIYPSNWILNSLNEYEANIPVSAITQEIVDKGTVQVFISDGAGGWAALPFSYADIEFNYVFKVGVIMVSVGNSSGSAISNPGTTTFKTVVISGQMLVKNPGLNLKNYNEVKRAFNL